MSDETSWALVSVRIKSERKKSSTVFARRHQFEVGQPITFDREDPDISSMEYLAGAVAADLIGTLRKIARRERVTIEEVEATARGELNNALTFLGVVGEEGDPALKALFIKIYVGTSSPRADLEQVWQQVLLRSPLYTTLRNSVAIETDLQLTF